MWEGMEHREIQQAEGSRQRAEDKRQKTNIFLWERLSSRDLAL
jgi:hypothetical protein